MLTDDIISENWRTPGLPIGNYYASLGNKYAYFYAAQCVNENPEKYELVCFYKKFAYGFVTLNTAYSPVRKGDGVGGTYVVQKREIRGGGALNGMGGQLEVNKKDFNC